MVTTAIPAGVRNRYVRLKGLAGRFTRLWSASRPVFKNVASMPLTGLGFVSFCAGVFTLNLSAGLMVSGVAAVLYEYLIADEQS